MLALTSLHGGGIPGVGGLRSLGSLGYCPRWAAGGKERGLGALVGSSLSDRKAVAIAKLSNRIRLGLIPSNKEGSHRLTDVSCVRAEGVAQVWLRTIFQQNARPYSRESVGAIPVDAARKEPT